MRVYASLSFHKADLLDTFQRPATCIGSLKAFFLWDLHSTSNIYTVICYQRYDHHPRTCQFWLSKIYLCYSVLFVHGFSEASFSPMIVVPWAEKLSAVTLHLGRHQHCRHSRKPQLTALPQRFRPLWTWQLYMFILRTKKKHKHKHSFQVHVPLDSPNMNLVKS